LSQRLVQEHGRTIDYTQRVIDEYQKFAFLSIAIDHSVVSSDPVDQAWLLTLYSLQMG